MPATIVGSTSFRYWIFLAVALGLLNGPLPTKAAENTATEAVTENRTDNKTSSDQLFVVPEGSPKQLLAFIQNLAVSRPSFQSRDEMRQHMEQLAEAISTATDAILAGSATAEQANLVTVGRLRSRKPSLTPWPTIPGNPSLKRLLEPRSS